jgi:hypothetical protein
MSTLKVTHLQNESNSAPSISISSAVGGGVTFAGISTFHGAVKLEDGLHGNSTNTITASTNGSERLRIDSSGRLLKSGQAALTSTSLSHSIQVASASDANAIAIIGRAADDIGELSFYEADKSTKLGELQYRQDHLNFRHRVGDIRFATGGTTERLRITSAGLMGLGASNPGDYDGEANDFVVRSDNHTGITIASSGSNQRCNLYFSDGTSGSEKYRGAFTYDHSDDSMMMRTGAVERLRITSAGNVNITDGNLVIGTSGHGIDFSVTGDGSGTVGTNGELLDEYEEGFFTPTIVNGFSSANMQYKAGRYTRIGNHVYCDFYIRFNTGAEANGNPIQIGGLPFTISNLTYGAPGVTGNLTRGGGGTTFQDLQTSDGNIAFYGSASNNIFNCYVGGTAWATVTTGGGANAKFIIGFYQYHAQ